MSEIRFLVVDDDERFRREMPPLLQQLDDTAKIDVAGSFEESLRKVHDKTYELAVIDIALTKDQDEQGMEVVKELRRSKRNQHCGVIIVTANATTPRVERALNEYKVFKVIDKHDFDSLKIPGAARSAIFKARLNRASVIHSEQYHLTISFNEDHLLNSTLIGPNRSTRHTGGTVLEFDAADLVRRTDLLNWMITHGGASIWRPEARSIGKAIYAVLSSERNVLGNLNAARALAKFSSEIWLRLIGPAAGLGIPFELLRDENEFKLSLNYILTRQITSRGSTVSRKPESFHDFLRQSSGSSEKLRVLIVGPHPDDGLPDAEAEAHTIAQSVESNLKFLGFESEINLLVGSDAAYEDVVSTLKDEDYHIFHYAGHGHHDAAVPERSGLVMHDKYNKLRHLTTTELNSLLSDKSLRLVFLSCCLSASTADRVGRGDFHSIFEALTSADIPVVAGYRWAVGDKPAKLLAETFYQELWRTYSPGEAMLRARQSVSREPAGLDDETWASPVLLMQNV